MNTNCTVYKLGLDLYRTQDKNSGLHEYDIIQDAVKHANILDTLLIINGKFTTTDEQTLDKLMQKYKKKIFICSDAIAFRDNIDIINECDILLHQCPYNIIPHVRTKVTQHYSYVPELFYYPFNKPVAQDNLLFYGGGLRNTDTLNYTDNIQSKTLLKTDTADHRLNYNEYIEEAMKHKFAFIISRQEYIDLGWVTSRFVEAASCWNYPIVDMTYDRHQYFGISKVLNYKEAQILINKLSNDEFSREHKIQLYRDRFAKDRNKFVSLLEELIK